MRPIKLTISAFGPYASKQVIDFEELKKNLSKITELIENRKVLSAYSVGYGGVSEAISKMSFGNKLGFKFNNENNINDHLLFNASYGNMILELKGNDIDVNELLKELDGYNYQILGNTIEEKNIIIEDESIDIDYLYDKYNGVLESIFPVQTEEIKEKILSMSLRFMSMGSLVCMDVSLGVIFIR